MKRTHIPQRLSALLLCMAMIAQSAVLTGASGFAPKTATPDPSPADDFEFDNGEIEEYTGSDANVVIPASIDGKTVTKLGQASFMNNTDLEAIVIPSTVTYIDDYVFDYCYSLEEIYFYGDAPENLASAFSEIDWEIDVYCKSSYQRNYANELDDLEIFTIYPSINASVADPQYATHNWEYTDNKDGTHSAVCTDKGCTETITNEKHTYTNSKCICGATVDPSDISFFNFTIANDEATVAGYTGPGGEITIPSSYTKDGKTYPVTAVAARAFNGSNGTTSTTNAESLSKITKITVPASVTKVGDYAFNYVGCYATRLWSLKEIVFEGENVTFGKAALGSNPNLVKVTLPSKQTEIANSMFNADTSLAEITIPASVTTVGQLAFQKCTALRKVTFEGSSAPVMTEPTESFYKGQYPFIGCQSLMIYVPDVTVYSEAWTKMLSAGIDKAGDITLCDATGIGYIADFKEYVNGTTSSSYTPQYMEYHVVSLDSAKKSGTVELKYVGWNSAYTPLEIPSQVTKSVAGEDWTFTVVGIGENAMEQYKSTYSSSAYSFKEVTFPETLTYIKKWGCTGLKQITSIDLSKTKIEEIGSEAFRGCSKLAEISLPATLTKMGISKTVTSGDEDSTQITITSDENIFACCDVLENINVAEDNPSFKSVDGILYSKDGKKLIRYPNGRTDTEFAIPEGVEVIASQAFMQSYQGNSKLTKVTFPSTLKEIESLAFRQSNLTEVTLPAGVKFGSCAFDICKNLKKVTISEGVTELSDYMFWSDEGISVVRLPKSLKKIGDNCFGHCTGIQYVDLNEVEEIGEYAFYYNSSISDIVIPGTVKAIGRGAFVDCQDLTKVTFEEGCTVIAPFMFASDYALVDLTLADSIEEIGEYAFDLCVGLKEVTMPKSLKRMGEYVFYQCWKNLEKVTFPDEVEITSIPVGTFYSCQALKELNLGKNISSTGAASLYDTNFALVVNCTRAKDYFKRDKFDVYAWDLENNELFSSCVDTGEKDGFGYPIYKVTLTEEGVSGGCGGGSSSEDGYYYIYSYADPTFNYGTYEETVLDVEIVSKDDTEEINFKKSQLESIVKTDPITYQYRENGKEKTINATKYITVEDLLKAAGVSFGNCDVITVTDADGNKLSLSHADSLIYKYAMADGKKSEVPAALLLEWNETKDGSASLFEAVEDNDGNMFVYGISEDENGKDTNVHALSDITSLKIEIHAAHEAIQDKAVIENIADPTCTESGSYDEAVYCEACKDEISRTTKEIKPAGHTEAEPVEENKKAPSDGKDGSHDEVIYCSVCDAELSRTSVTDPVQKEQKKSDAQSGAEKEQSKTADTSKSVKTGDAGVLPYVILFALSFSAAAVVYKRRSTR